MKEHVRVKVRVKVQVRVQLQVRVQVQVCDTKSRCRGGGLDGGKCRQDMVVSTYLVCSL